MVHSFIELCKSLCHKGAVIYEWDLKVNLTLALAQQISLEDLHFLSTFYISLSSNLYKEFSASKTEPWMIHFRIVALQLPPLSSASRTLSSLADHFHQKKYNFLSFKQQIGFHGKESACNAGDPGSIPGSVYPLQYSGLENSMDCIVHGVAKSRTWLSTFHFH